MLTTIQDVAEKAGVSVATVSRVMNNSERVLESTRAKVLKVMTELDYKPNHLGRNLRKMKTNTILVLLPSISNPFYSGVVKGIEDVAKSELYNVLLCNTDSSYEREASYIHLLENRTADGVIFMETAMPTDELSVLTKKHPIVQCSEYKTGTTVPSVSIDNKAAAREIVNYLIQKGRRRIGLITCDNQLISTKDRFEGYKQALFETGIPYDRDLILMGNYTFRSGYDAAKKIHEMQDPPDAVFAISDVMAIGLMNGLKKQGFNIPEDILVAGFDNISFAIMSDPALTTIEQPRYDLGAEAMRLLLSILKKEMISYENVILKHKLIIRESTG